MPLLGAGLTPMICAMTLYSSMFLKAGMVCGKGEGGGGEGC